MFRCDWNRLDVSDTSQVPRVIKTLDGVTTNDVNEARSPVQFEGRSERLSESTNAAWVTDRVRNSKTSAQRIKKAQ